MKDKGAEENRDRITHLLLQFNPPKRQPASNDRIPYKIIITQQFRRCEGRECVEEK